MSVTRLAAEIARAVTAVSTIPVDIGESALRTAIPTHRNLLDEVIRSGATDAVDVRLNATSGPVHPRAYTTAARDATGHVREQVSTAKVVDLFAAGATVIIDNVARAQPALAELTRTLGRELAVTSVDMALFATPNGHSGLPVHVDDVDVVVIQLAGAKRWDLWDGTSADDGALTARTLETELAGIDPTRSHVLGVGAVMFVPAGTPHRALAVPQAGSVHLSIMVNRPSVRDLLVSIIESAARDAGVDLDARTRTPSRVVETVLAHLNDSVVPAAAHHPDAPTFASLITVDDDDAVVLPSSTRFHATADGAGRVRLIGRRGTTAVSAALAADLDALPTDTSIDVATLLPHSGRDRNRAAALTLIRAGILERRSNERTS
ncbi:JmjC domain-containing protein [Williamsia sp. MIQD14]|uniref:JmjC domain-containing protein n=1 Tax=Williamsia sp. MIQD14 TaxID=3425703 RepID=UPI003DA0A277